jgi:hypothetical protein
MFDICTFMHLCKTYDVEFLDYVIQGLWCGIWIYPSLWRRRIMLSETYDVEMVSHALVCLELHDIRYVTLVYITNIYSCLIVTW